MGNNATLFGSKMESIEQIIHQAINQPIVQAGYEIVAVEYNKPTSTLTIFVDKEGGGISLDDCETVNHLVDPLLETLDPTHGKPYTLNVSSPGLDRHLKTQRDFERNYGREVEIKLKKQYKKKYNLVAMLLCKTEQTLSVQIGEQTVDFAMEEVQFVHPAIKFGR